MCHYNYLFTVNVITEV